MAATVAIIMGIVSWSEALPMMMETLQAMGVEATVEVVSAHRMPDEMVAFAKAAAGRGLRVIIAGAGGAAHLPGMVAALTALPVLGVPVQSKALNGLDSLLSIVQMPAGVPVATFAIGPAGATNAALFAVRLLALGDAGLTEKLEAYRAQAHAKAVAASATLGRES